MDFLFQLYRETDHIAGLLTYDQRIVNTALLPITYFIILSQALIPNCLCLHVLTMTVVYEKKLAFELVKLLIVRFFD